MPPNAPASRPALLLNRRSGTLLGAPDLPDRILAALAESGLRPEEPPEALDLDEKITHLLARQPDLVIVGGGDGTVRAVAARLAGTGIPMAILPLGTLNLMARDLNMPLDPVEAAQSLAGAAPRDVDLGEVNGEAFLCQAVIGVPNAIGRHRERHRGNRAHPAALFRFAVAAARALLRHRPMRLAVLVPGRPRPRRVWTRALSVVNNAYGEGAGMMFHRPRLDGGELVLHVARGFSLGWALRMLAAMALGKWKGRGEMETIAAPALTLTSRRPHLRVMADGEAMVLATPLRFTLRAGALRFLAPPAAEGATRVPERADAA